MPHKKIIQLVIAYTLAGAVVFTVVVTCLSLVGWIRFADSAQQQKLFYILIVELATIAVGFFSDYLKFNPDRVQTQIEQTAISDAEVVRRRLWALTEIVSPSVTDDLTNEQRKQFAETLRTWYYTDGNGIYLSRKAADLFLKAKASLTDPGKDSKAIREAFSALRTQLKMDAGVYSAKDAEIQIGPN
jgi:hypothetical protein